MSNTNLTDLKTLVELTEKHNVNELEIREGNSSIRICRNNNTQVVTTQMIPATAAPVTTTESAAPSEEAKPSLDSPMVGTVYLKPSPDSDPFVKIGQKINKGDIFCLIEAMKTFNKIKSEKSGTIVSCFVQDGQPIAFGQKLFIIEED